ncbi:MFS transporter [Micromonospora krabiensis]|uniref:Major Facilitator Superfamily protein n=1 Tax=Micromonospora krabiensis TaxID=307121 RepID=A0A1C3N2W1_9ACTN|nr:MFS transporter [Micromonospora krabiensis]SBV26907.1 Major Facilitator Superfamily protein [Micromonospora krabiensis]
MSHSVADRPASRLLLPVAAYGVLLLTSLQSLVVPLLNQIQTTLHSTPGAISWVMTANLLAAAVLTPVLARLGDLRGRRTVLLGVTVVVLVGSLLAATTENLPLLLVARAMQGTSYALLPLAIGLLRDELPPARLTGATAIVSGTVAIGAGFGLVATGLLVGDGGDYHRVFWLATAMAVIALVAIGLVVPRRQPAARGRVDWAGAALLGGALVLLLLPLEKGNTWGWASARVGVLLVASAVAFAAFVAVERRVAQPLVNLRMFSHRPLAIANIAGLLLGAAMFVGFLTVSAFVQTPPALAGYGFGATVLSASIVYLLPGALSGVVTAPLGGRLVARYGAKATLALALLVSAVGFALLAAVHATTWQLILSSFLVTNGVTLGYAALPALLIEHVTPAETGVANSVNSIARSVGSAIATALVVTMLSRNPVPGLPVPLPQVTQYTVTAAVTAVGVLLVALLVVVGLPHRPRTTLTPAQVEADDVLGAAGLDIPAALRPAPGH